MDVSMIEKMDGYWMSQALEEAQKAFQKGEVPIGAVYVSESGIMVYAHNQREQMGNPFYHAEINVLEDVAFQKGDWRLGGTLYVTLEPCPMCLGALLQARVDRLIYGCEDPKRPLKQVENPVDVLEIASLKDFSRVSGNNHTIQVRGGVLREECSKILKNFFAQKRG